MTAGATVWTGARVNVGRSLRISTHCEVNSALGGPRKHTGKGAACSAAAGGDRLWCAHARLLGYESIQISHGNAKYLSGDRRGRKRPIGELVHCSTPCMEMTFSEDACVPVARYVSSDGTVHPCACAKGHKGLTCDGRNESSVFECPGLTPYIRGKEVSCDLQSASIIRDNPRPDTCKAQRANLSAIRWQLRPLVVAEEASLTHQPA